MPASVMQRAEAVMINIAGDLRRIQSHAYDLQDTMAQKTHDGFLSQKNNLLMKTGLQGASLAARVWVVKNPGIVKRFVHINKDKEAIDLISNGMNALSTLAVEPSSVSIQANMQKLQAGQTELATFHSSLQSMMQTHDAALQRLQNMEGANRQAG